MKRFALVMMTVMTSTLAFGAPPRRDGAQVLQQLRKLQVVGSALYVAAHPDDENTRLLATLANESLVRTSYLAFTRGEGGQNLIGAELGPLLGVIRTQELLAARRVDGAEQFFTRARDFGYSKSVDETLAIWDHDRVLADAVFVIRSLQPDVIITRFSLEGGDTHGHHTASARLALEAFHAAADPRFHPEQLETVGPWQARRIVWNAWAPDGNEKLPPNTLTWDSSLYSPLLGQTYGELAADSRSMHKSQGFGAAPLHGPNPEYFVPLAGEVATKSLFDGVDLTWKRVAGSEKVAVLLARAVTEFKVDAPAGSVPVLVSALEELRRLPAGLWKAKKEQELVEAIAACAGVFAEAAATSFTAVPGATIDVNVVAMTRASSLVSFESVRVGETQSTTAKAKVSVQVPARFTTPYFLEQTPQKGSWSIDPKYPIGLPVLPAALQAEFVFTAGTQRFSLFRDVMYKWVDPTVGERQRPLEVLPTVVLRPAEPLLAFVDAAPREVRVTLSANADAQQGVIKLSVPDGFSVQPDAVQYDLRKRGDEVEARVTVKRLPSAAGEGELRFEAQTLTRVDYAHIPMQTVLSPAKVKLVALDLKRGKTKRVGYIVGAGDDVPASLRQVGYEVTLLSDEALKTEVLGRYDAIVVGIRAYNTNPRLPGVYGRLMQYVKDGGTLVAQYNTRNWLSNVPAEIGPYPFEISQDRVTDEDAQVTFTAPRHRVLDGPNRLTEADFKGWVQERGLYFATKWDAKYETPLSMHDPNEAPLTGSLLITRHGKGRFVYTGLSFFRELPAGVPGAWRLFANLLDHDS